VRVVFDTNVFVAARLSPEGVPAQLVRLGLEGAFELVLSPLLLDEVAEVLARPKFRFAEADVRGYLERLRRLTVVEDPADAEAVVNRDRDDDYLVALAVNARADTLVSGDRDLVDLTDAPVSVLTPRAFLHRLRETGMLDLAEVTAREEPASEAAADEST
jgi:uncharacterized protein